MKKGISIGFITLFLLSGCVSNSAISKVNEASFYKGCDKYQEEIILSSQQANRIYNTLKQYQLDKTKDTYEGCLGDFEFILSSGKDIDIVIINKNLISYEGQTYKTKDIDLFVEALRLYYDLGDKKTITLDELKKLVKEKGKSLRYHDLEEYLHYNAGDYEVVYHFPIDNQYSLFVSCLNDANSSEKMMLINDKGESIEIRENDIDSFINQ